MKTGRSSIKGQAAQMHHKRVAPIGAVWVTWLVASIASAQLEIYTNDQLAPGATLVNFTASGTAPLTGAANLELSTDGTWARGTIQDMALDVSSLGNWANAYLEFSYSAPQPVSDYGEVFLTTEVGSHVASFKPAKGEGYHTIQIALTEYAATQAAFGNTLQKMTIASAWAAGTLVVDEIRIVEGSDPAGLAVFRENLPKGAWMVEDGKPVTTNPFAGRWHLELTDPNGGGTRNVLIGGLNIDTMPLTQAWNTAGISLAIHLGTTKSDYNVVTVTTDAGAWTVNIGGSGITGNGEYMQIAHPLSAFTATASNPLGAGTAATAANFGTVIKEVWISGKWPDGTYLDEIFFTNDLNLWPVVSAVTAAPDPVQIHGSVDFTVTATDDGTLADYTWDFGDGSAPQSTGPAALASHVFTAPGTFSVRLTATDDRGGRGSATVDVTVECPSTPPALTVDAVSLSGDVLDASVTTVQIAGVVTPVQSGSYQSAPIALSASETSVTIAKSPGDAGAFRLTFRRTP